VPSLTVGSGDPDSSQVSPSVEEFLALWRERIPVEDVIVLDHDAYREAGQIIVFHKWINSSGLRRSLPNTLWNSVAKIFDCFDRSIKSMCLVSPPASEEMEGWEDLIKVFDEETEIVAQMAYESMSDAMKERLQAEGKADIVDAILKEELTRIRYTLSESRKLYRKSVKKSLRWTLYGLKLRLDRKLGGLGSFCDEVAALIQLQIVVEDHKRVLAGVLPSTFIFHRGALDLQEGVGNVPTTLDLAEIAVQADPSLGS